LHPLGAALAAGGGGAWRFFSLSCAAVEVTMAGGSNRSTAAAATAGNEKTLRVSASIYNKPSGTTTAEQISASG
jgi:hypothetical protein